MIPKQLSQTFINTRYFREPAIAFENSGGFYNGGRYTQAPIHSKEWYEFWEEQERRCLYGYSVGGVKITGRHYWYLNFTPIKRTTGKGRAQTKVKFFPRFWAIDYDWFWYKEVARWGCTEEFLKGLQLWREPVISEENLGGGRHVGCLKTRRAGFSWKEASDGVYNYNFFPESKTYYMAALKPYLEPDGILNKVDDIITDINNYTDGYWRKNRQKRGTIYNQKASYMDPADGQEKGYKSEIIGIIVDNPDKARGKDAIAVKVEEGGSFKNLKAALAVLMPSLEEGGVVTGQASVFGTGGEEGADIEGLASVFGSPDLYNMLLFPNDWEGYLETECGIFVPYYMANNAMMDDEGNIDVAEAIKAEETERDKKRKSKDPKDLDRRLSEYPGTPTEALLRVTVNSFPTAEALAQKRRILRDKDIQSTIHHGELVREVTGLKFQPNVEHPPINHYPHKDTEDLEGCISIIEHPIKDNAGNIDDDLYFIVVDPFYTDQAKSKRSLGVARVYRKKASKNGTVTPRTQCIAWYVGRPTRLGRFHEQIFALSDYYNAPVQSEIAGGGQGIIDYARGKKLMHRLMFDIATINNKEITKGDKNRSYFIPMSTEDKKLGLIYYGSWLRDVVGITAEGVELWNLHFIFDLGLLEEIINFNPESNADRISADIIGQFVIKEQDLKDSKKRKKKRRHITENFKNMGREDSPGILLKDGEVFIM